MSYGSGDIGDWQRHRGRWGHRIAAKVNGARRRRQFDRGLVRTEVAALDDARLDAWADADRLEWDEPYRSGAVATSPHCETCCCDLRSTRRDP